MKLRSIGIKNFRSFQKEQLLTFPDEPGLYFMQGVNNVDKRLGGNGAGKSTIWEAFHWLVEGKTSKGLKAGDVCNWESSKGTSVNLMYEKDGREHFVTRTWGPISWTLDVYEEMHHLWTDDLAKAPENLFLADLGVTGATLQHCIFMAQDAPMFFDLKRDAQAEMFGSVLGLDHWIKLSEKASEKARQADRRARDLESEVANLSGKLEEAKDYRPQIDKFEAERRERLDRLGTDFDSMNADLVANGARHKKLVEKRAKLVTAIDSMRPANQRWRDRNKEIKEEVAQEFAQIRTLEERIRSEMEHLEQMTKTGTCSACGLNASAHPDYGQVMDRIENEASEFANKAKKQVNAFNELKAEQARVEREFNESEDAMADLLQQRDYLDDDIAKLDKEAATFNREMDALEEQMDRLKDERNPFKDLQEEASQRTRSTQDALKRARQALDRANEQYSLYGLWIRGFKEIRLQEIAEALTELEIEVNSSVEELGLSGWEIRFDVDRETKGGGVQRGFTITVRSPDNDKAVPWESWSGGEKQRLRLAGQMGFANLIRTRMGVTLALEVWDEPFKGLSWEGERDTLACLERRARVEGLQIWIVDHASHDFGGFSGEAQIIKDSSGSRIEQN